MLRVRFHPAITQSKLLASSTLQIETDTVPWIPVPCGGTACCGYTETRSASSFSGESGHGRYALMFLNGVDTHTTGSTN